MSTLAPPSTAALRIKHVTASYGSRSRKQLVLQPTSLTIDAGDSLAVVGPSGAGKSTLAGIVLGLIRPDAGQIDVAGEEWASPSSIPGRRKRRLVQGVPQDASTSFPPRWTLGRSIAFGIRRLVGSHDIRARIERAAASAQLPLELLERYPAQVSGGQAQRAALVRALAVSPTVLVADEPTSALDRPTADALFEALLTSTAREGTALMLITHDPTLAAQCSQQLRIAAPNPTEREKAIS